MKICVIGASGLIGKSLIERLTTLPDTEITAFDRIPAQVGTAVRWIQGDLQNLEDCLNLVRDQDVIFHLAHTNSPLTSDIDLVQDSMLNLIPTLKLLKAIEIEGGVPHLIYPSSGGAIYGTSETGICFKEDDPCLPLNSYGIQKLIAEHYIRLVAHRGIITATVFRIANAYGWLLPPDRPQGLIGTAVTRFLTGQPIRLFGNPANVRDYIHITSIIDAFLRAMQHRQTYNMYNIGTGIGTSVEEVIEIIERVMAQTIERIIENIEFSKFLPNWCVLDAGKAYRDLGWRSSIEIELGISELIEKGRCLLLKS